MHPVTRLGGSASGIKRIPFSSDNYSTVVMSDAPLGYWRMNEASGTTFADSSGNGNHLTVPAGYLLGEESAVYLPDSKSTKTDGATGITIPSGVVSTLLNSAQWSIEGWFTTPNQHGGSVIGMAASSTKRVHIQHYNSQLYTKSDSGGDKSGKTYNTNLWRESWHHFVLQSDGRLWINNHEVGFAGGGPSMPTTVAGRIGQLNNGTGSFTGWLAEFSLYTKLLGTEGVNKRWHAAHNISPFPSNRTWRWDFSTEVPNQKLNGTAPRAYYYASATRAADALSRHSGYTLSCTGSWAAAKFVNITNDYHKFATLTKGAVKLGWRFSGTMTAAASVIFFLDGKNFQGGNDAEGGRGLRVSSAGWVMAGNTYGTPPVPDTWYDLTVLWDRTHPTKKAWLLVNGVEVFSTANDSTQSDPLAYHHLLIGNDTVNNTSCVFKYDYFEIHGSPESVDL